MSISYDKTTYFASLNSSVQVLTIDDSWQKSDIDNNLKVQGLSCKFWNLWNQFDNNIKFRGSIMHFSHTHKKKKISKELHRTNVCSYTN